MVSELTRQLIERIHHRVHALGPDIRAWVAAWNHNPKPRCRRTKTAEQILQAIDRLMNELTGAGR